ncbi:MAG: hypothetical protein CO113_01630 [Elusimicrobia bacterium CG_4_9_14_3_um_filter_62_55]|nr:MAG: hypothetical protein COR54_03510 [Elusimicrobia bacterium CG22_combo_CG10-13_8_21_14_all_63_91]PJA12146.1 MAG: hypothetical protein COX66_18030 [Elusimicrobia bacterium CG_4_10_14_0_2_um_filter_63_34]PJB26864.1 MAG: hypothetical protein CO113_01630 [Elusimicrobia bacterium CG_4_9_14_3_um_filter_62_55]
MRALLIVLLAAAPARAIDDYSVTLRLEDGEQETRTHLSVAPGGYNNAVFVSTRGGRVESTLFNVMTTQTPVPSRVDLSYQFEWSLVENGNTRFVRQAVDWSRIPERREVLLVSVDERWRLWATVEKGVDRGCRAPAKGGGLSAKIRVEKDGVRHAITRRTSDGVTSGVTVASGEQGAFDFMMTPALAEGGREADVEYRWSLKPEGSDEPFKTKTISLGREQALEDGVFVFLERLPVEDPAEAAELSARDPETGWYLYSGDALSFSFPPEWKLREICGKDRETRGWDIVNRSEPENPLHAVSVWGMLRDPGDDPPAADGDFETLAVKGGGCVVRRDEVSDPLCRENCAASFIARAECRPSKSDGRRIDFHFDLGREAGLDTERYARFLRFVKSFELKD